MRLGAPLGAVALTAAALLLGVNAPPATADGDPASDFLLTQTVFTPFNQPPTALRQELIALADAAKREGFPIRVAVIQAPADLGAIPQLLGKPQTYARFLGSELRFAYRGRLLVVMRQGYGYTENGNPVPQSSQLLRSLPKPAGGTSAQLTSAAITAIRRVASASGHPLPANPPLPPTPGGSAAATTNRSFFRRYGWEIVGGLIVLTCMIGAGGALAFARTRSREGRGG